MFAVIQLQGSQHIVSPGDTITVPHKEGNEGDVIHISDVLLLSDDKKTSIGTPHVKGASVEAKIVSQHKGEKIRVSRFKSKVRYRKTIGFRPLQTDIQIVNIVA